MELNHMVLGYLFLRLAPFILVCFFTLSSLFNSDWKGVIYLAGLLLSCVMVIMSSGLTQIEMLKKWFEVNPNRPEICKLFTLGQTDDISSLPLGQMILSYTFTYLLYPMIKNNVVSTNIPTLLFFPILIIFDFIWNINNGCYAYGHLLLSSILGALFGYIWSLIISNNGKNMNHLYFSSGVLNAETCSKPSKSTFKCNVYKNGKLISKNIAG